MSWTAPAYAAGRWALSNSAGAALVVLLILAVQFLLKDRISAGWRHNLWLLVIVRLMLPTLPGIHLPVPRWVAAHTHAALTPTPKPAPTAHFASYPSSEIPRPSPTPVLNDHPRDSLAPGPIAQPLVQILPNTIDPDVVAQPPAAHSETIDSFPPVATPPPVTSALTPPKPAITTQIPWTRYAQIIWLTGVSLSFLWLLATSIRLRLLTRAFQPLRDDQALQLLEQCRRDVGLRRSPLLVTGPPDFGPALIGFFRPRLIIPPRIAASFDRHELRAILLHELVHLRRADVAMNYLLAGLTAVHWFNPFVHLAFARLRAEREIACDEAVLRLSPPRLRLAYGCTILKLLELAPGGAGVPTAVVAVIGNKGLMQRRIAMIANFDRRRPGRSPAAAFLTTVVAGAALTTTSLAQDKPTPPPLAPAQPVPSVQSARQAVDAAAQNNLTPTQAAPDPAALPPGEPVPSVATAPPASQTREGPSVDARPPTPATPSEPNTRARRAMESNANINSPRSVEDASVSVANATTFERLKHTHPMSTSGVPLREVLRMLADIGKLDIVTDDRAISESGVDPDVPVNLNLHDPRSLEQILEMSLRLAGPQIDYSILNGVIFVSSRTQLNSRVVTRVYDVGNADHNNLTDLLINGTGLVPRVSYAGDRLVITASELTQRHVAKLLAAVSDQMSQKRAGQTSNRGTGPKQTIVHAVHFADAQSLSKVLLSVCSPNFTVAVDSRTNSLVITAADDDQTLAQQLIAKLDQPGKPGNGPGEDSTPQSAQDTLSALRRLAETVVSLSDRYGPDSPQVSELAQKIEQLGTESSSWIDRLTKDGNNSAANKLRKELDQVKALLAPLANRSDRLRAPEAAR